MRYAGVAVSNAFDRGNGHHTANDDVEAGSGQSDRDIRTAGRWLLSICPLWDIASGVARLWGALVQRNLGALNSLGRPQGLKLEAQSAEEGGGALECESLLPGLGSGVSWRILFLHKIFWPWTRRPPGASGPGSLNRLNPLFLRHWI